MRVSSIAIGSALFTYHLRVPNEFCYRPIAEIHRHGICIENRIWYLRIWLSTALHNEIYWNSKIPREFRKYVVITGVEILY